MKEIYRKTSFVGFISGLGACLFVVIYYFFSFDNFADDGLILMEGSIIAVASLSAGLYFKKVATKLEDVQQASRIDLDKLVELNIQWVPSLLPKMYNVDADGKSLFKIEPSKRKPIARNLLYLNVFTNGFIFPATYDVLDMEDGLFASFTSWTNGNRYVLTLFNADGVEIGRFEQRLTKSKLKNMGTLFYADGSIWRELEAENLAGDIDVKDDEGEIMATYRYGRFPYALNPAFQAEALHSHIHFASTTSTEEKLAYTMIFFFWLRD